MRQLQALPGRAIGLFMALAFVMLIGAIQGCASISLEGPQNFKESEILTMAIATEVLNQADILQNVGKIKPADARNLVKQTDQVKDGVAIAKGFESTSPATANARIQASLKMIQALRDYLVQRGGTFSKAASG